MYRGKVEDRGRHREGLETYPGPDVAALERDSDGKRPSRRPDVREHNPRAAFGQCLRQMCPDEAGTAEDHCSGELKR